MFVVHLTIADVSAAVFANERLASEKRRPANRPAASRIRRTRIRYATALTPVPGERGAYRLRIAPDANVSRAAEEYGHEPLVARAEPNYFLSIDRPPVAPDAVRTELPSAPSDTVRIPR